MKKSCSQKDLAIVQTLENLYGKVPAFLYHQTPFQLLIAVILSAQTTDALVNTVTPTLFQKYPDAHALSKASVNDVEVLIRKVNYYRTKAKNIIGASNLIEQAFNGKIPETIVELTRLPGVGRKVANVIVSEIYNIPEGMVVDTHIKRVSFRIGWTDSQNPAIIERDIMRTIPQGYWVNLSKQLILIGRNYCFPRNPDCKNCPLQEWCEKRILLQEKVAKKHNRK